MLLDANLISAHAIKRLTRAARFCNYSSRGIVPIVVSRILNQRPSFQTTITQYARLPKISAVGRPGSTYTEETFRKGRIIREEVFILPEQIPLLRFCCVASVSLATGEIEIVRCCGCMPTEQVAGYITCPASYIGLDVAGWQLARSDRIQVPVLSAAGRSNICLAEQQLALVTEASLNLQL